MCIYICVWGFNCAGFEFHFSCRLCLFSLTHKSLGCICSGGGGGGGTFVYLGNALTPLLAAGGGGGGYSTSVSPNAPNFIEMSFGQGRQVGSNGCGATGGLGGGNGTGGLPNTVDAVGMGGQGGGWISDGFCRAFSHQCGGGKTQASNFVGGSGYDVPYSTGGFGGGGGEFDLCVWACT